MDLKEQIKQSLGNEGKSATEICDTFVALGYSRADVQSAMRSAITKGDIVIGRNFQLFEAGNPNATKQQLNG